DGKTLFNGYLIAEFSTDADDSTYIDSVELWINEVAFMWNKIHPSGSGGIPGYDIFIIIGTFFVSLGLISLVLLKKRKNLLK
ncbi:MAG: hypothetical protein ACFFBD_13485, partial [Candidatus Hodarchaeota archaeon]